MKKVFLTLAFACAALAAFGSGYDKYYENIPFEMERVQLPAIPDNLMYITEFGGVGDGYASNTQAFAKAMESLAAQGGGTLVVPRGTWITGPIHFTSNVNLQVDEGALILFSDNFDEYPIIQSNWEGWNTLRATSPIMAWNVNNIAITGKGIIDGNGDKWRLVKKGKMTANQWRDLTRTGVTNEAGDLWFPNEGAMKGYYETRPRHQLSAEELEEYKLYFRPVLASIVGCKNVLLQGVTFQNSPSWNLHPLMCENVTLDGVIVRNPWYSQNGDGLDVESCKNVLVVNSSFDVGDDAICVKSGKDKEGRDRGMPTENMIVDNCIVYHGHGGFVIGSEMSGGARNIMVRNCNFIGTDVGLRFKSTRGRGGVVEKIWIENIDMINIPNEALLFDLYYGGKSQSDEVPPVTEETPSFRDITIRNITCRGAGTAMLFNGIPEMKVKNVTVDNAVLQSTRGIVLNHTDHITLTNVSIKNEVGEPVVETNSSNVTAQVKELK